MRRRRPTVVGADAAAIARSSRVVTAQITLAAAGIVILVVALSVAFILDQSQPRELLEKPIPGETKIYVDADEMFIALIVVGIIAIALAAVTSWVIARRAVRPLGEALRIQRTFVADASHELRTPVAVVAARVELLKQEIEAGDDTAENLVGLQQDVRLLGDVITDLLLAAAPPTGTEPDLVTVLENAGAAHGFTAQGRNRRSRLASWQRCRTVLVDCEDSNSGRPGVWHVYAKSRSTSP